MPDTQWLPTDEPPFYGTAIHVVDAINREMVRQKVDFVIEVGDLVEKSSMRAFQTRAACNKMLEESGIDFYPLRGNHDSCTLESVGQFKAAFPNLPGTPGCGGSSPALPGAEGMTYSFVHRSGKFLLLDTFPLVDDGTRKGKAYTIGDYLPWIEEQLGMDDHRFALVFAHKNLLGQNHKDNVFSDNEIDQDMPIDVQNAFLSCLQRHGVRYFICGHDHMYHRSVVNSPDGKSAVQQVICGSAAHKFYTPQPPFLKREKTLFQELRRIGFLIVRVGGQGVRMEYHSTEPFGHEPASPRWEIRDGFGYVF